MMDTVWYRVLGREHKKLEGALPLDIYQACTVNADTCSGSGGRPEWTPHGRSTKSTKSDQIIKSAACCLALCMLAALPPITPGHWGRVANCVILQDIHYMEHLQRRANLRAMRLGQREASAFHPPAAGLSTEDTQRKKWGSEYTWRRIADIARRAPVPMLNNPFSEVKFPNIQAKPPLTQLEAISSRPITCYLGEETDPTSLQPPFR
ncbi:hypothetical protein QYF61_015211 [Mycteria americana]|uniref:Uncharacterized protein n=1 Tax=Mycteria americana TaxID=33587 RepID=A0AAN7MMC5_MYCAM|nr:hypothetical protein QYF61_015211 [Mycteria americana]